MPKLAQSVKKTKCCNSSEFQVVKGKKPSASSWKFSVKISNRFEGLRDNVTSIEDETNGLEGLRLSETRREYPTRSVQKNQNSLTKELVSQQTDVSNRLASETVDTTDVFTSNKVLYKKFFYSVIVLLQLANPSI